MCIVGVGEDIMNTGSSKLERGFTLIEVLAAIVILSIVSLVLTSYFANALTYVNNNQNKTVMVNLARNALFYVEKQDFEEMQDYFEVDFKVNVEEVEHPDLSVEQCATDISDPTAMCSKLFSGNTELLKSVLNPTINGVVYNITISYQAELHEGMLHPTDTTNVAESRKAAMAKYLLPVRVTVSGSAGSGERTNETVVEGYITNDKIR
jgi:prepilin-type N-terminal cleavage/methylation domain-containing protein